MGRRCKLTDAIEQQIVTMVRAGADYLVAARKAGVPTSTAIEWRARGEGTRKDRPAQPRFERLVDAVETARAEAELAAQLRIQKAAQGGTTVTETRVEREYELRSMPDGTVLRVLVKERTYEVGRTALPVWQADAWWLERARAERWRKKQDLEITGEVGTYLLQVPPKAESIEAWQRTWGGGTAVLGNGHAGNGAANGSGHGGGTNGHTTH
jgi:hypothetical protein